MFKPSEISCEPVEAPVAEIAAAKAAGKCGDCYVCCAGYHDQCKGPDFDWHTELAADADTQANQLCGCGQAAADDIRYSGMCTTCYQMDCV